MVSNSAVKVSLIILGLTVAAFLVQKTLHEEFPGNYPKFAAPVKAGFEFTDRQVRIRVPDELNELQRFRVCL